MVLIVLWLLLLAGFAFACCIMLQPMPTLPSSPLAYGGYAATATLLGGGVLILLTMMITKWSPLPDWIIYALLTAVSMAAVLNGYLLQRKQYYARVGFEQLFLLILAGTAALATLTAVGIVFAVTAETVKFFQQIALDDFLFGTTWSPQIAIRPDQVGAQGAFGIVPLLAGTLLITAIAMVVATPTGLVIATYLSEFSAQKTRNCVKPILELLAGIPTVVYGFFAVVVLSPILRELGSNLGVQIASESALAAGLVMGVMLIPFVSSLAEDALFATPNTLRQGALALGSTKYETALQVVIPAALPGIMSGILLALSRAIGETMIVVMAAGISAQLTANPLATVTTVTVQIVTLLTGDQEFDDPKTLAAFALGLTLFLFTLILNLISLHIIRKHQLYHETS